MTARRARSASCRVSARTHFALHVFLQREGVVVLGIMRTVEERYRAVTRGLANRSPNLRSPVELRKVFAPKFRPLPGIVTEPLAQTGAGTAILAPALDMQRLLFHSPRPEPFHQIAHSILRRFLFV